MSTYQTLLGSYRMSQSTAVLPPPQQTSTPTRPGSSSSNSATLVRYSVQQTAASSNNSNSNNGYYAHTPTKAPISSYQKQQQQQQQYMSTSASSSSSSSSSSYYYGTGGNAAARQPLQPATADSTKYSSTSSSSTPTRASAAATSKSSGSSSAVLTQVQRTSTSSSSSRLQNHPSRNHPQRSSLYRPKSDPTLRRHPLQHRPLLILDLDETLVHASTQRPPSSSKFDVQFDVDMGPHQAPVPVWVAIRPYAREFLFDVAAYFEVAVFTASIKNYADKVCEALDPQGRFIQHRLYRDHCTDVDGVFVKDLSLLGRPMHRMAILDNSPHAYLWHPELAIPILSWFDDVNDRELKKLTPMLIHQLSQAEEVHGVLEQYRANMQ